MHPAIVANKPGTCPVCKMALVPKAANEKPSKPRTIPAASPMYAPGVTWIPEAIPPAERAQPGDGPAIGNPKRRVFSDEVRAAGWLESPERLAAVLYRDELGGLSPGERGTFFRARAPREPIEVRLGDEAPTRWDDSTSIVRFVVARPEPQHEVARSGDAARAISALERGDVGWLEIGPKSRELLVVPESALLRSSDGPYVIALNLAEGDYARRPIQIGRILRGQVVVLSGLDENDAIVVGGAFFLDTRAKHEPPAEAVAGVGP
jgi:hypothetical protein